MAGKYDFTIEQGATFSRTFTWKDGTGEPVDLTGYTARMSIVSVKGDQLKLTEGEGITLDDNIRIYISAEDTAALDFVVANYDLELAKGEYVKRLLEGTVKLSKEVTK